MTGIDTNVLVRYLVQDDPEQAAAARRFLEQNCTKETPGIISQVVLCELVWVLLRGYRYSKEIVADAVGQLLTTSELSAEGSSVAWAALRDFRAGNADFADYLIAHRNKQDGCRYTVTFDRKAGKHELFRLLGA